MKSAGTTVQSILDSSRNRGLIKTYVLLDDGVYKMGQKTNSWSGSNIYHNRSQTDFSSDNRFSNNSWTFGFVRNPWDRMVSAWKWGTGGKMSFSEFVLTDAENMDLNKLIVRPLHIKQIKQTQFNLLTDKNNNIKYIDRVCKFENINDEVRLIREKIGANTDAPVPHLRKTSHKHYKEYYDKYLIDVVAEKYKIDIETFKYDY